MFKKKTGFMAIIISIVLLISFTACGDGGGGGGTTGGTSGNTPGGDDGIPGSMSAYVSTNQTDEYFYELSFESNSSAGRAAVNTPKEGGKYSLIVYDVKDGKVKGVSEGKIKGKNGGYILKPNDENDPDITVTVTGGDMTELNGETKKGGKHKLPGRVKPFKQNEGVYRDFRYANNPGDTVTITKYTGNGGDVTIPDKINGKTVIGIGYLALSIMYNVDLNITSVTISNTITSIGAYAFSYDQLTNITIPDSVTSIGQGAFSTCFKLASVTIGNGVTVIGVGAFFECTSLTSVTIPDSVSNIEAEAFEYCTRLASITMGNGVTYIGYKAFESCTSLTSVTLGNSVTNIGEYAFSGCNLTGTLIIPNSVTSIGQGAFSSCTGLTSVTIGSGVNSLGGFFPSLNSLTEINVDAGNTVYSSQDGVLYNKNKTAIILYPSKKTGAFIIPNTITGIGTNGSSGFTNCTGLTSITIPSSVTSIANMAFYNCTSLTAINVDSGNTVYSSENGVLYNKDKTTLVNYPGGKTGAFTILDSVRYIGDYSFYTCSKLTSVTIGSGVFGINQWAFANCKGLTSITIPTNVQAIGVQAFYNCTGLTSITFETGSKVFNIGGAAFCSCTSLTSIILPSSVIVIQSYAFDDCTSLTSVTFESSGILSKNFGDNAFSESGGKGGNKLRTAYLAAGFDGYGTYTRPANGWVWTKQ